MRSYKRSMNYDFHTIRVEFIHSATLNGLTGSFWYLKIEISFSQIETSAWFQLIMNGKYRHLIQWNLLMWAMIHFFNTKSCFTFYFLLEIRLFQNSENWIIEIFFLKIRFGNRKFPIYRLRFPRILFNLILIVLT